MTEHGPDPFEYLLTLAEAARRSGVSAHTLAQQAERGRLQARKLGRTWVTTTAWLDAYLATHARRRPQNGREGRPRA